MYKFRGFAEEETYHVKSLLRSVGEIINNDLEMVERAKKVNKKYFQNCKRLPVNRRTQSLLEIRSRT